MHFTRPAPRSQPSELRIAIISGLLIGIGPISLALFTPAMPEIAAAFRVDNGMVQLALSVYLGGFAVAQLLSGPLADTYGRRPILVWFLLLFLGGSIGAVLAQDIRVLLAMRLLQGVGAAAGMSLSRAIVRDLFTGETSARILNLISLILATGPALAPAIGGVVITLFGWEAVFALMVILGIATLLMVWLALPETLRATASPPQLRDAFRSYASLLGNPHFIWPSLTLAGAVGAFYTQAAVLPFIVVGDLGYSATQFGLTMLFISSCYFAGVMLMGWLIPRIGAFRVVPVGLAMLVASGVVILVLPFMPRNLIGIVIPIALFTAGNAFILPAMYTASMAPFPDKAGAAASLTGFLQMGIGFLGASVAGVLADAIDALAIIVPAMAALATISWYRWRRLPNEP
jgi:DHA1 family bicyclomycin/chloramphenicol resistance-like MFS transporter